MAAPRRFDRLEVRRLAEGALLVLPDAECCVIVLRGTCQIQNGAAREAPLAPGTLILRQSEAEPSLDLAVARSLELMSRQLSARWTVEALARAVALSRPAFAKRFVQAMGVPPLRYLSALRLELAANLLRGSEASLAELAQTVGYVSEFAFSRAFKRRFGVAPSFYRRRMAAPPSAGVALLRAA